MLSKESGMFAQKDYASDKEKQRNYLDYYEESKMLGRGSQGIAFLVKSKEDKDEKGEKKLYCAKKSYFDSNKVKERVKAETEIQLMKSVKHQHICEFKESFFQKDGVLLIMEYCDSGDLEKYKNQRQAKGKQFSEEEVMDFFIQICMAVEYIHVQRIIHRDLKPENIFLTKTKNGLEVRLGDFGVSRHLDDSINMAKTNIGTPYYTAPEIIRQKGYDFGVDVWSIGVMTYEIATFRLPFPGQNIVELWDMIQTKKPAPFLQNEKISKDLQDLIIKMLEKDPKKRPNLSQLANEKIVKKYNKKFSAKYIQEQIIESSQKQLNHAPQQSVTERLAKQIKLNRQTQKKETNTQQNENVDRFSIERIDYAPSRSYNPGGSFHQSNSTLNGKLECNPNCAILGRANGKPFTKDDQTSYSHLRALIHKKKLCRLGERCFYMTRVRDHHIFDIDDLVHVTIHSHPTNIRCVVKSDQQFISLFTQNSSENETKNIIHLISAELWENYQQASQNGIQNLIQIMIRDFFQPIYEETQFDLIFIQELRLMKLNYEKTVCGKDFMEVCEEIQGTDRHFRIGKILEVFEIAAILLYLSSREIADKINQGDVDYERRTREVAINRQRKSHPDYQEFLQSIYDCHQLPCIRLLLQIGIIKLALLNDGKLNSYLYLPLAFNISKQLFDQILSKKKLFIGGFQTLVPTQEQAIKILQQSSKNITNGSNYDLILKINMSGTFELNGSNTTRLPLCKLFAPVDWISKVQPEKEHIMIGFPSPQKYEVTLDEICQVNDNTFVIQVNQLQIQL